MLNPWSRNLKQALHSKIFSTKFESRMDQSLNLQSKSNDSISTGESRSPILFGKIGAKGEIRELRRSWRLFCQCRSIPILTPVMESFNWLNSRHKLQGEEKVEPLKRLLQGNL